MNTQLRFSEEQAMVLESAKAFCRDNSTIEHVRALLADAHEPEHIGYDQSLWQSAVDLGWLGISIPEQFGGSSLGIGSTACIAEAMGRYLFSTPFFSCTLGAQALLRAGSLEQQQNWLPKIAHGSVVTFALLEDEDWGVEEFRCAAKPEGEGFTLSGIKHLVCDASAAEAFIVAVEGPDGKPMLTIVETEQLLADAIKPHVLLDETKRAAQVDFTGVTIKPSAVLDSDKTAVALRDLKLIGALLIAAEAVGSTAASLGTTVDYLKTRTQFGQLIGSYQALKHPAVDILCNMDSAKSLVYHAATLVDDKPLSKDAEIACRMAKVKASEALLHAGDRGIQFHGGMGFTYECDAQLYIRRAQWIQQHYGDAGHHRKRLAPLLLD